MFLGWAALCATFCTIVNMLILCCRGSSRNSGSSFLDPWGPAHRIADLLEAVVSKLRRPVEQIQAEVDTLRASAPPWLIELSDPNLAPAVLSTHVPGSKPDPRRPDLLLLDNAACRALAPIKVNAVVRGAGPYDSEIAADRGVTATSQLGYVSSNIVHHRIPWSACQGFHNESVT